MKRYGYCAIGVSEGLQDARRASSWPKPALQDAFGHAQLGGVAPIVAALVQEQARLQVPLGGRRLPAALGAAHRLEDRRRAVLRRRQGRGRAGAEGQNAVMPAIVRISNKPYRWKIGVGGARRRRQRREEDAARLHHRRTASTSRPSAALPAAADRAARRFRRSRTACRTTCGSRTPPYARRRRPPSSCSAGRHRAAPSHTTAPIGRSEMLNSAIILALACAAIALSTARSRPRWILAQPDGNDRMREIAAAIQAGAKAYLNRQYRTIAMVGAVLFVVIGSLLGWMTALGFAIGAVASGARGLHRHERVGARQRAHRRGGAPRHRPRARHRLQGRRDHRHAGGGPGPARRHRRSSCFLQGSAGLNREDEPTS